MNIQLMDIYKPEPTKLASLEAKMRHTVFIRTKKSLGDIFLPMNNMENLHFIQG
jgi:hypothetical protein